MQLELKASMWESSTKLIPYMLITLKLGVALFNVLIIKNLRVVPPFFGFT